MKYLRKYLRELQGLDTEIVTTYVLQNGKKIPEIDYKGQKYKYKYDSVAIQDNAKYNDYRAYLLKLANDAITDILLCNKEQQDYILAKLQSIERRLEDPELSLYSAMNSMEKSKDNLFDFYNELEYSLPYSKEKTGTPSTLYYSQLSSILLDRMYSLKTILKDFYKVRGQYLAYEQYGFANTQNIYDPYLVIDCCSKGLHNIKRLFEEQVKPRYALPDNADPQKVYSKEDMHPVYTINNYEIGQELPFIDFRTYKRAVRNLLLNSRNTDELKNILEPSKRFAKENIELFVNELADIEKLSRGNVKDLPEKYNNARHKTDTKHIIFNNDFRITYVNSNTLEYFQQRRPRFYINRDLAIHSEEVLQFLRREIYKDVVEIESKVPDKHSYIKETVIDYLEPFKDNEAITERDYNKVVDVLTSYLADGTVSNIEPVFVKRGNDKKLAYACGQMYRGLKLEAITKDFLELLTRIFIIYQKQNINKTPLTSTNLYKYCTTKPQ